MGPSACRAKAILAHRPRRIGTMSATAGGVDSRASRCAPTRSDIFSHGGARHEAEWLGVPFLGEVPLHMDIRRKSDSGQPLVATAPEGPLAAIYR
jgi:hypothetical protein